MHHFTPASSESKTRRLPTHVSIFGPVDFVNLQQDNLNWLTQLAAEERKVAFPHRSYQRPLPSISGFHAGSLISHIFRVNEICRDAEWERYFCYESIEVPDSYTGPRLTFPMTFCGVSKVVQAFKHKQVGSQAPKTQKKWLITFFLIVTVCSYSIFFPQ